MHVHPHIAGQIASERRRDLLAQAAQERQARQLAVLARASRRAERAERRMRQAARRVLRLRARLQP